MLKKIITTQPHWILLILGISYFFLAFTFREWHLNRTIGWGWDVNNFIWFSMLWVFVMPISYWFLLRFKFTLNPILITIHILAATIFTFSEFGIGAHLINWALFFLNLLFATLNGRKNKSRDAPEVLDQLP